MNTQTLLTVVLSAFAAVVGALVATLVGAGEPAHEVAAIGPEEPADAVALVDIRAEVAALRQQNQDLLMRLIVLEDGFVLAESGRAPIEVRAGADEFDEEARALVAALAKPGTPVPAGLRASIDSALQDIREQEDREREDRRRESTASRLEDRLA